MKDYSVYEIIDKKKRNIPLSKNEIFWMIDGLKTKKVADYQMAAFLMAIYCKGMSDEETAYLTDAMLYSGKVLKFSSKKVVDKHSTGGVGDKTSFILAPIAAAAGVKVPMIAGRGLGFTGGTVDKIEAIKNFKTTLTMDTFKKRVMSDGVALIGQTADIAPADKVIYALRDVTATIDSIPLITASIMSKKLAEGANGIVMDIKLGSGAFMRDKKDARALAKSILNTATRFNKKSVALITNMDQPLGDAIGNTLEIIECIDVLKGKGPKDITELSVVLAANMIHLAGIEKTYKASLKKAWEVLNNGKALEVFRSLIKKQGGDPSIIDNYKKLPLAKHTTEVKAIKDGYIKSLQTDTIGLLCTELGGGRKVKTDKLDFGVGFIFHKKVGDKIKKGESIFTIYHNKNQTKTVSTIKKRFFNEVMILSKAKQKIAPLIYEKITANNKRKND